MRYHTKCETCRVPKFDNVKSIIKMNLYMLQQAQQYASMHWTGQGFDRYKQEIYGFKNETIDLENELDRLHHADEDLNRLQTIKKKLVVLKNMIDDSESINHYLKESKYEQLEYSSPFQTTQEVVVQQQIMKKVEIIKEQVIESTHKELKKFYDSKLKTERRNIKKELKSRYETKFSNQLDEKIKENSQYKDIIDKKAKDIDRLSKDNEKLIEDQKLEISNYRDQIDKLENTIHQYEEKDQDLRQI